MSVSVERQSGLHLGLGLIGIGRQWGVVKTDVPGEAEVFSLLEYAVRLGVTFFDTAPAYGLSERRLGAFLRGLAKAERERLFVATKFGEHWDPATETTYVDHSYHALVKSLETSFELLGGRFELLQIHKATLDVLKRDDVQRALALAANRGIPNFGASGTDTGTLNFIADSDGLRFVQMPLNARNTQFAPLAKYAVQRGKAVIVNRPFAMGQLVDAKHRAADNVTALARAFTYICAEVEQGVVLTGTKNKEHLAQNVRAFKQASEHLSELRR